MKDKIVSITLDLIKDFHKNPPKFKLKKVDKFYTTIRYASIILDELYSKTKEYPFNEDHNKKIILAYIYEILKKSGFENLSDIDLTGFELCNKEYHWYSSYVNLCGISFSRDFDKNIVYKGAGYVYL